MRLGWRGSLAYDSEEVHMSRTRDGERASCNGGESPPDGGGELRAAVAQRQYRGNRLLVRVLHAADRFGIRLGVMPLAAAFSCVALVATALYAGRAHDDVMARTSDRISILADGALVHISMAVIRAEPEQVREAANPALLNAMAYRHLADGIYAYVLDEDGALVAGTRQPAERLQTGDMAATEMADGQAGHHHEIAILEPPLDAGQTFKAETVAGQTTVTAVRPLPEPFGKLVVAIPTQQVRQIWLTDVGATLGLIGIGLAVLLPLALLLRSTGRNLSNSRKAHSARKLRFETALSRARCGLWDWDISRGRIMWSPSMSMLVGLPAEERVLSLGELEDMTHPEDRHFRELAEEIVSGSTDWIDRTFRLKHTDGQWIWIRARAEIREIGTGSSATELVGIAMDITEQMRLAELSQTADQRLRDAIECVSEAFVLWGSDGSLLLSNSKYAELAKLGRGANDNGDGPASELEAALATLQDQEADSGQSSVVVAFPEDRWVRFTQQTMSDGGRVAVGADITDLKNQEDMLRAGERQLLNTVVELQNSRSTLQNRTQQLLELAQRYGREKTRAEMANKAKSDFLASMSHELRTPLNAILGFSDVMLSGVLGSIGNQQYREYCEDIRQSGAYLLAIITDILDMSRIEAGRFTLNVERVELSDLAVECVDIMRIQAQEKHIETIIDIQPGLMLDGDRRAIKQTLLNILSNAVKFTGDGGVIKVRARSLKSSVRITIEDNGRGIPARAIRKLGRPFEQVGDQHTRSHSGSGLGLAISRSLVELHHGRLSLKSRLGEGTAVSIRLPLHQPDVGASQDTGDGMVPPEADGPLDGSRPQTHAAE